MAPNCFLHIVSSCDVTQSGSGLQLESNGKRLQLYEQALQKVIDHAKAVGTDFDKERYNLKKKNYHHKSGWLTVEYVHLFQL